MCHVVGATVATEPAIPYALAAPLPMITANTLAGRHYRRAGDRFRNQRLAAWFGYL
ncbi:PTS system subunit IIC [Escherichia coli]|uniref:PTS system subunit IIC n=1 Tax=Escherichia coli TaxID=562 RepID=A0A376TZ32_ECOLX|nr:PTS system subunit IIC [Escherichia coli]